MGAGIYALIGKVTGAAGMWATRRVPRCCSHGVADLPVFAGLAPGLGVDPLLLVVSAAVAASCAFMLPVATPPNTVVFGSQRITLPEMARTGVWLNAIGILLITGLCYALVIPLLGR